MQRLILALALAALPAARSQVAPTYPQNGLTAHNRLADPALVAFPGFGDPAGNGEGDCLWKVLPGPFLLHAEGRLHLTGLELAVADLDPASPLDHPDVEIQAAREDAAGRLQPDPDRPLVRFRLGLVALPGPGAWVVNWSLAAPVELPVSDLHTDRPLALCLLAAPGESAAAADGALVPFTAKENYAAAPQGSFSGSWLAARGALRLASAGWPDPLTGDLRAGGELWAEPAFAEPVLQPRCSSATLGSYLEPDLGIGAFYADLATGSGPDGLLGWRLESDADGSADGSRYAFLLLNYDHPPGLPMELPGLAAPLALDGRDSYLTLLILAGGWGPVGVEAPAGTPPELRGGAFHSPALPCPRNPLLAGTDLWVAALVVDLRRAAFASGSTTSRLRIR